MYDFVKHTLKYDFVKFPLWNVSEFISGRITIKTPVIVIRSRCMGGAEKRLNGTFLNFTQVDHRSVRPLFQCHGTEMVKKKAGSFRKIAVLGNQLHNKNSEPRPAGAARLKRSRRKSTASFPARLPRGGSRRIVDSAGGGGTTVPSAARARQENTFTRWRG